MDQLNIRRDELMHAWYKQGQFDQQAWIELLQDYLEQGRICAGTAMLHRYNRIVEQCAQKG